MDAFTSAKVPVQRGKSKVILPDSPCSETSGIQNGMRGRDAVAFVDTKRILQTERQTGQNQPLVPEDWVLIHRLANGTETQIAENVLAWDMSSNGEIVWTDGRHVFARPTDGTTRKIDEGDVVERVVALVQIPRQVKLAKVAESKKARHDCHAGLSWVFTLTAPVIERSMLHS